MRFRDILGMLLFAAGVAIAALGYRVLGLGWCWIGAALTFAGLLLVLNEVRRRKLERELRQGGGPGDWGDRHYLSGGSADPIDAGD